MEKVKISRQVLQAQIEADKIIIQKIMARMAADKEQLTKIIGRVEYVTSMIQNLDIPEAEKEECLENCK